MDLQNVSRYLTLCKPKVVLLMLITTWVGMLLASNLTPDWPRYVFGTFGIACIAGAAAALNHLFDQKSDLKMQRTAHRPLVQGTLTRQQAWVFSMGLILTGTTVLLCFTNWTTTWLTLFTLLGYAGLYTLFLKHQTSQNIVIGGISGAMPPLLGWTCITGELSAQAWALVLIIFTWTPPHFWALAVYRHQDYKQAKIPMLPVTHGIQITKLCIVLYTILLLPVSLFPYLTRMSHEIYLLAALCLNALFIFRAIRLYSATDLTHAKKTFQLSIWYLFLLFSALIYDQWVLGSMES